MALDIYLIAFYVSCLLYCMEILKQVRLKPPSIISRLWSNPTEIPARERITRILDHVIQSEDIGILDNIQRNRITKLRTTIIDSFEPDEVCSDGNILEKILSELVRERIKGVSQDMVDQWTNSPAPRSEGQFGQRRGAVAREYKYHSDFSNSPVYRRGRKLSSRVVRRLSFGFPILIDRRRRKAAAAGHGLSSKISSPPLPPRRAKINALARGFGK